MSGLKIAQTEGPQARSFHLAVRETQVSSPGWEDPLEKEMATCSSIFA